MNHPVTNSTLARSQRPSFRSPSQPARVPIAAASEINDIGNVVWASPVKCWTDILERALVTHYWFRDEKETGPDIVAARGLISAVLAYSPTI